MSTALPWSSPLGGRDPDEEHRVSTPLELLFDLCFVVAVAAAAAGLHHSLAGGEIGTGLKNYAMVFFAIWWAWVNYSWFASAYDTGDVRFRLTTFVIMTGVLVLAAAIPAVEGATPDYKLLVVGYLIMRIALVPMWLRVTRDHPAVRRAGLRYALGITVVQVLWVTRLGYQDGTIGWVSFIAFALLELSVPFFAEVATGQLTPWHEEHIAERYELFTIIVLGEVILATTQAISVSLDQHDVTANLLGIVAGGLLLVLSLWWIYFKRPMVDCLDRDTSFYFGYAHFLVFGSIAAVGASLATTVDTVEHHGVDHLTVILLLAGAVSTYLLALGSIHAVADRSLGSMTGPVVVSALVFAAGLVAHALSDDIGLAVLLIGLSTTAAVVDHQVRGRATA